MIPEQVGGAPEGRAGPSSTGLRSEGRQPDPAAMPLPATKCVAGPRSAERLPVPLSRD